MKRLGILIMVISIFMMACETTLDLSQVDFSDPPTVIYKMKKDYSQLVPVVLNDEKTAIIAYPAPKDLFDKKGELRYPSPIGKGYYLDELGVGVNTAYIDLSIDKYSQLIKVPSLDSLMSLIIDDDPFKRMYNLGNRKQYLSKEKVEEIISSGDYKHYQRLK